MKSNTNRETANLAERASRWIKQPKINHPKDGDLAVAAVNAIECLTTVPLESLRVTARHGFLHLEGTVSGTHQRAILEEVTRHVPGIWGVVDSTTVQPQA